MIMLLLALQAALAEPGALRTFDNWTVACDNGGACQAAALLGGEEAWGDRISMTLQREAGPDGALVALFDGEEGAALMVDGARLPVRLLRIEGRLATHPDDGIALADALARARALALVDAEGRSLGRILPAGAAAMMRHIDARQGRGGTATALVDRGTRPAAGVPAPRALPEVRLAPLSRYEATSFDPARIAALRQETGCTIDEVGGPNEHEAVQVEDGTTLILLACGSGAYNVTAVPLIARAGPGGPTIRRATFDAPSRKAADGPSLINAQWDSSRRILSEFSRGRGMGDCGTRSDYGWDGERFRLVRREEMEECLGARSFVTTWRARVVRP